MTSSALRQAEAFTRSVLALLGLELRVPDHMTLLRRGRTFAGRQPRVRVGGGPMHLVLDSTGLELFGQGEWCAATRSDTPLGNRISIKPAGRTGTVGISGFGNAAAARSASGARSTGAKRGGSLRVSAR